MMIFLGCVLAAGCAKVSHLDQLLTLKDLADEQTKLNQYTEERDRSFDRMLKEVKAGTLAQYANKRKVLRTFGEPIFAREIVEGDQTLETWLYRYATKYFGAEKVYLYFDPEGNLVRSEYQEGKDGESGKEATTENGPKEI
jgi:hypothetical protein